MTMDPEKKRKVRKSQADKAVELLCEAPNTEYFLDQNDEPYCRFKIGGMYKVSKLHSRSFKTWFMKLYWDENKKSLSTDAFNTALDVLEGNIRASSSKKQLYNRIAHINDELWYDLADSNGQAVRVAMSGWNIEIPPTLFKRYEHHKEQFSPERDGDAKLLLKYVNIQEKHQLLFLVYMISCFINGFPHPLLLVHGPQGSAKSTLSKILRAVIDPSKIEVAGFPRSSEDLVQLASHNSFIIFDNVSKLSLRDSDILCKIVTGSSFAKRKLYTDDDDHIIRVQGCVGLNGINLVGTQPDLLERSIIIELEALDPKKRKQEKELWKEFQSDLPKILGGIFDVLSNALIYVENIEIKKLPRMADFAQWGEAISIALGFEENAFIQAFEENANVQHSVVLEDDLVAVLTQKLMECQDRWNGSATLYFTSLKEIADESGIDLKAEYGYPRTASSLSKRLKRIEPNLRSIGISVRWEKSRMERVIVLEKTSKDLDVATVTEEEDLVDIEQEFRKEGLIKDERDTSDGKIDKNNNTNV